MVLNLVISGIPSILKAFTLGVLAMTVLNLVISGIPSILQKWLVKMKMSQSFKPCYKWNTFNTLDLYKNIEFMVS